MFTGHVLESLVLNNEFVSFFFFATNNEFVFACLDELGLCIEFSRYLFPLC